MLPPLLPALTIRIPITAPDGQHVIIIQGTKLLQVYRTDDLTTQIGLYSLYGDIEMLDFTSDSAYLLLSIADTRLFFLLLCDPKLPSHMARVQVSTQSYRVTWPEFR